MIAIIPLMRSCGAFFCLKPNIMGMFPVKFGSRCSMDLAIKRLHEIHPTVGYSPNYRDLVLQIECFDIRSVEDYLQREFKKELELEDARREKRLLNHGNTVHLNDHVQL